MARVTKKQVRATANKLADKTKTGVKKVGKGISDNPKTALYIGLGALALYVGYKIFTKVNTVFDGPQIDNDVSGTGGNTNGATISDQQARNFAQQLLDAMNYKEPFWGTDEDTIERVFDALKNSQDFIKIYNIFGRKDYNGYNSPPEGVWSYLDSFEPRDLVYWLQNELSEGDGAVYTKVKSRIDGTGLWVF